MKPFRQVEETRREYHGDPTRNSVHRASLLAPEIEGTRLEIVFLNHFLIKRGYRNVACRVSAFDREGRRIGAKLLAVVEPRVHVVRPAELFDSAADTYQVEFHAAENLFIPFPAVMVNHVHARSLNAVHAYNRVLNDVFEDDAVNATRNPEASFDVGGPGEETLALFSTGIRRCSGALVVETAAQAFEIPVDQARLTTRAYSLGPAIAAAESPPPVLRIRQPEQFMFYGRMLILRRAADGGLSGNHSYYDSSGLAEYWDDARPSHRVYPYFPGLANRVRMHPIMSPGEIDLRIDFHDAAGRTLGSAEAGRLASPGPHLLDASVDGLAASCGVDPSDVSSFAVVATPCKGPTPTRVNHQLVHSAGGLESSINVSLLNPNVFDPPSKRGFAWGQIPVGSELETQFGLVFGAPGGAGERVDLALYGPEGELGRRSVDLAPRAAWHGKAHELFAGELGALAGRPAGAPAYVWFAVRATRPDIHGYAVTRHRASGHCTGEHSF